MAFGGGAADADRRSYLLALGSGQIALLATAAGQLISIPLQISAVGVEGFGVVSLVLTWLGLAAAGVVWLTSGGVRRLGETAAREEWNAYHSARIAVHVCLAGFGLLLALVVPPIGLALADHLSPELHGQWPGALLWISAYAFLQYEQAGVTTILTAGKRQHICNLGVIAQNVVFIVVLWLLLRDGGGLSEIFFALAAGLATSRLILAIGARRGLPVSGARGRFRSGVRDLLGRRGAGYTAYGTLTLFQNADMALVGLLGGSEAAGLFGLVWRIPTLLVQVLWRIPAYLEPYIIHSDAAGNKASVQSLYTRGEAAFYSAALLGALLFGLFGYEVLEIWVGAGHAPAASWIYWAAGGAAFWLAAVRWPINFLHAMVRLRGLVAALSLEIVLRLLLIVSLYSIAGFAAPFIAVNVVMGGLLFWMYRKLSRSTLA